MYCFNSNELYSIELFVCILTANLTLYKIKVNKALCVCVDELNVSNAVTQLLDLGISGLKDGVNPI